MNVAFAFASLTQSMLKTLYAFISLKTKNLCSVKIAVLIR